ncbi:hypothetical protein LTR99_002246 [Exophiala xenobiotica]|uniref:Uncharacterized protein n=1 Tax=Vermiconidia calcicola TaxID=1690605 RepID=A0AAV9QIU4_9PEZI|nr:hypothetical protein LTR47_002991 [Exophiala xenobiotica]KAK5542417.1 hypothetical protein LTR25_002302 [Vermiconidia calcicola]KAK5255257.1 hypothetical protein LTS06_000670 [Exophiala xenobiotica]KAK5298795.1 hypothetical protein LTR14_002646 [Exophiala xenobiotica]KAK5306554.1 hypothetical protein LTR99_002246 [Exophiala xenobiotica]
MAQSPEELEIIKAEYCSSATSNALRAGPATKAMSQKKKQSGRDKKEGQEEQQSVIPEAEAEAEAEGKEAVEEDGHNAGEEATLESVTISLSDQAENNMVLEAAKLVLTITYCVIDIILNATKTVASSPKLLGVVLGLFVVWFVFGKLGAWTVALVDMGVRLWHVATQGWVDMIEEAFKPFFSVYHWTVDIDGARSALGRVTLSTVGKDILCTSSVSVTLGLASWLNVSCKPSPEDEIVYKTLRKTAHELGYWAGISEVLVPHVNSFQLATIPLTEKQAQLKHNKAQVMEKKELLDNLDDYIRGLFRSARCMYAVTLATDHLLMILIYNLEEVHMRVHAITIGTKNSWWPKTYREQYRSVNGILTRLLDVIDVEIAKLLIAAAPCINDLIRTTTAGVESRQCAVDCQIAVMRTMKKQYSWFRSPDMSLIQLKSHLTGFAKLPTGAIVDELSDASRRLEQHQQDLQGLKSVLAVAYDLSTVNGLTQLLNIFDDCLSALTTARGSMILGKAREREQYEKQAKDGFFTAPPMFSTVSPAAA